MKARAKLSSLLLATCMTVVMSSVFAQTAEKSKAESAENKAAIEALHGTDAVSKLSKEWQGQPIVFSSSKCTIDGTWAWVEAAPGTKDGKQHFEGLSGVMHKVKGKWQLAAWVSGEVASAQDPDGSFTSWSKKFVKEHPDCPEKIFPAKAASK
jgi:hypothetical protein